MYEIKHSPLRLAPDGLGAAGPHRPPARPAGPARSKPRSYAEAGQRVVSGPRCGKSFTPLAFVIRLRKDTRRTLMVHPSIDCDPI